MTSRTAALCGLLSRLDRFVNGALHDAGVVALCVAELPAFVNLLAGEAEFFGISRDDLVLVWTRSVRVPDWPTSPRSSAVVLVRWALLRLAFFDSKREG